MIEWISQLNDEQFFGLIIILMGLIGTICSFLILWPYRR